METKKAVIPVKGMTCVNCAAAIQKDISKLAGVMNVNVNYANEKAVVEFDPTSTGLEQFITSIHESGYQAVTEAVTIPVIASGGVGNLEHIYEGFTKGRADAALAASIFHFKEYTIRQAKEYLRERGVPVRL